MTERCAAIAGCGNDEHPWRCSAKAKHEPVPGIWVCGVHVQTFDEWKFVHGEDVAVSRIINGRAAMKVGMLASRVASNLQGVS